MTQPPFLIGNGFDVHQLAAGRKLILGGVEIPHDKGLDGHSDADALLHAITDAVFGALGLGDIGYHFPNTDERWRNCDSLVFLREAARLAGENGYRVSNIDATLLAEAPKLLPHVAAMKKKIGEAVALSTARIGLKATTMETMGFVGRREGIAAMAVVLLERVTDPGQKHPSNPSVD